MPSGAKTSPSRRARKIAPSSFFASKAASRIPSPLIVTAQGAGVDRPFRDLIPVLAKGDRILWIAGLKPSREAAIDEKTTSAVLVRFTGRFPWEL